MSLAVSMVLSISDLVTDSFTGLCVIDLVMTGAWFSRVAVSMELFLEYGHSTYIESPKLLPPY